MRLFALETDVQKIKERFLAHGEKEVLTTYYHGASFFFASIKEFLLTLILFAAGIGAWIIQMPMVIVTSSLFFVWFFTSFFSLLKAWIDWKFDFLFVTTDRLVIVDQTSVLKQRVSPIHLENIASVTSETQCWDLFNYGCIIVRLKEGEGGEKLVLNYVPDAKDVSAKVSEVVTHYQRRPKIHSPTPVESQATVQ